MHYLSSVYFVIETLRVSGIFIAHHQEVYSVYTTIGSYCSEKKDYLKLLECVYISLYCVKDTFCLHLLEAGVEELIKFLHM